jgi:hypothetical protein
MEKSRQTYEDKIEALDWHFAMERPFQLGITELRRRKQQKPPKNRLVQLIEREEDRNTSVFRGEKSTHVLV